MDSYDIVVVGAGPAGSLAAMTAARNGARVLLLEEHKMIGIPVQCAEGITYEGLYNIIEPRKEWIASSVEGAIMTAPSKRSFTVHHPKAGYILNRAIFDSDLAIMARESGAKILTEARAISIVPEGIRIRHGKREIDVKAKIIIGADGIRSSIGKITGFDIELSRGNYWLTYQYKLRSRDIRNHYVELFFGRRLAPGGYGWVFPKGEEIANVGVGISSQLTNVHPKRFLDDFIKWRFNKPKIEERMGGRVPSKLMTHFVRDNIALCGDAARLVDPMSGAGIANALLSGKLAGEASARAVKDDNTSILKDYEKEWFRKKGREMRFRMKAKNIFMKLTDDDFELIYETGKKIYGDKIIYGFEALDVAKQIIKLSPRFLKLGRHLI